jgi:hypothetical protein
MLKSTWRNNVENLDPWNIKREGFKNLKKKLENVVKGGWFKTCEHMRGKNVVLKLRDLSEFWVCFCSLHNGNGVLHKKQLFQQIGVSSLFLAQGTGYCRVKKLCISVWSAAFVREFIGKHLRETKKEGIIRWSRSNDRELFGLDLIFGNTS